MNTTLSLRRKPLSSTRLGIELSKPSLVLLVLMAVLIVVSGLLQWERYTALRHTQLQQLTATANKAAGQISDTIWELQNLLWSLVSGQHEALARLTEQPQDEKRYRAIEDELRRNLRDMLWFTLFDAQGQLLVADFGNVVGTHERTHVLRFAENSRGGHIVLHPNAGGGYFGLTVPWRDDVSLFVSISPDAIVRLLAREQQAGQHLLLVRQDNGLIEVTTEGPRNKLTREPVLSEAEQTRLVAAVPVSGTLWKLMALSDPAVLDAELKRLIWEFCLIVVGLSIIVWLALWFINRETLQRQVAVRSLRQSEERFSQLAQHLHQVFWMYGQDGFLYVSPAFETVWGRPRQTLYRDAGVWLEAIHPEDRPRLARIYGQAAGRAGFDEEYRIVHPDGSVRWIWDRGFPVRDEAGQGGRIAGIAEDITERKQAAAALRETEASYKSVVEDQSELICRLRPDGTLSFANGAYCRYFGKQPAELLGGPFLRFVPEEDRPHITGRISLLDRLQPLTSYEHRLFAPDGAQLWLQWSQRALFDDSGRLIGYQAVGRDITERKRMDEALRQAHDELEARVQARTRELEAEITERKLAEEKMRSYAAQVERSNRELKDFAYVCSHDLQEPLRKIQAFGDRLRAKYQDLLPEHGRDYLDRMQSAAARMQTLINDLLALSRVENKALACEPVNLTDIARQTVSDLEVKIEETGAQVQIDPLPVIEADPLQMRQLLQNLVGNALKFQRRDLPPQVHVYGRLSDNGEQLQLYVEDNGIGFDEKYLDKIFTAFQRLHNRDTYEGTGIGLSICHRIVGRHGGSITARSVPGAGATFMVMLPVRQTKPILPTTGAV